MPQPDQTCCGVIEEAQYRAHRRRANKPQPWIALKFTVALTIALTGYSTYVYAGRFCKDMLMKNSNAQGGPATGVAFLVVFCVLLFLMSWSYVMVVTTSPGHARDYTQTTTRPGYERQNDRPSLNSNDIRGTSYELTTPTVDLSRHLTHEPETQSRSDSQKHHLQLLPASGSGNGDRAASQASPIDSSVAKTERNSQATSADPEEAHVTDVLAAPEAPHVPDTAILPTHANTRESSKNNSPLMISRSPPSTPVLLPEYRYCSRCKIIKPPRAHHCRACGTCILKYDHHCPWIGQCVGAFNHKFFVNFLQWGTVFCFWTLATLLGLNVKSQTRSPAPDLDPQQIVVIALSGLFGLFCILMFITQLHLIRLNQTTVESIGSRSMRDREQEVLSNEYRWYEIGAKRRTQKQWDNEWGEIGREGNLWWLGSGRANWEAVMGKNMWWWFLPIGHRLDDGMSYQTNPRFDDQGRWRRRKEWPSELR
ncbi:hypothetical protein HYDPIDRAFT_96950 [Hydnomerulius pinastri MD-312]|uniref:Palmitoyltransferase n=1 Tax=Hydnomerulius pinastri MD-312 TaxID=994086 RepID=A0A0C9VTE4_9AGAM|nr:hypothetical protein HYDPIDRAFT_96950 [Hydnomerulius pinastri MD-312]